MLEIIKLIGGDSWIMGIIMLPFFVYGAINVFRGFAYTLEKDCDKFNFKRNWQAYLYWLIYVTSYAILFIAIKRL